MEKSIKDLNLVEPGGRRKAKANEIANPRESSKIKGPSKAELDEFCSSQSL